MSDDDNQTLAARFLAATAKGGDAGEGAAAALIEAARAAKGAALPPPDAPTAPEAVRRALAEVVAGAPPDVADKVLLRRILDRAGGEDGDAKALANAVNRRTLPTAESVWDIQDLPPPALLRADADEGGALLPVGEVALLAGEGGTGKSALASDLALAVAGVDLADLPLAVARHGPVLWLTFEEAPGLIAHRMRKRLERVDTPPRLPPPRVVNLRDGWPLFGPGGSSPLYNARPARLDGWDAMAAALDQTPGAVLLVVDPALAAYVGEPNAAAPVREFATALGTLARERKLSVLLLAHAAKAGGKTDPFDRRQVGGSAAWTDAVRCALTLTHGDGAGGSGAMTLAILKANTAEAGRWRVVAPRKDGFLLGFAAEGGWRQPGEWVAPGEKQRRGAEDERARAAQSDSNAPSFDPAMRRGL